MRVKLFASKSEALMHLSKIKVDGIQLTDCNETSSCTSMTTANAMVEFVRQELPRRIDMHSFKKPEDLKRMDKTNCIAFGMRAGILLGDIQYKDQLNPAKGSALI